MAKERLFKGLGVSPGVAQAQALVVNHFDVPATRRAIAQEEIETEIQRFREAVAKTRIQLTAIRQRVKASAKPEPAGILDAYREILQDPSLIETIEDRIAMELVNAEWALAQALEQFRSIFLSMEDPHLRERGQDIHLLGQRLLRNLMGVEADLHDLARGDQIVVAKELSPADTALLGSRGFKGLITRGGTRSSHAAIVARSLGLPAVVGVEDTFFEAVASGDPLLIDGHQGVVILYPTQASIVTVQDREMQDRALAQNRQRLLAQRPITLDGHRVHVQANASLPAEAEMALRDGVQGIGLLRTEFLLMHRPDLPTEEDHCEAYSAILAAGGSRVITIRTLDLGGDKQVGPFSSQRFANPLGLRGIRFCLENLPIFRAQLRGLLRAGVRGRLRILLPMISDVEELRRARALIDEARADLAREGLEHQDQPVVGVMIEVPSAVLVADHLAAEADFLSIGTNDLIQYTLAVDRSDKDVAHLYRPLHPALLRALDQVVQAGHKEGKPVAICGEMAGEPLFTLLLLALGLDELSMDARSIPNVMTVIQSSKLSEAKELLQRVMAMRRCVDMEGEVRRFMAQIFPEIELMGQEGG